MFKFVKNIFGKKSKESEQEKQEKVENSDENLHSQELKEELVTKINPESEELKEELDKKSNLELKQELPAEETGGENLEKVSHESETTTENKAAETVSKIEVQTEESQQKEIEKPEINTQVETKTETKIINKTEPESEEDEQESRRYFELLDEEENTTLRPIKHFYVDEDENDESLPTLRGTRLVLVDEDEVDESEAAADEKTDESDDDEAVDLLHSRPPIEEMDAETDIKTEAEESIPASEEHNPPAPAPEGADVQNLDAETDVKPEAEESIPASEEHNPPAPAPEEADVQNLDAETDIKTEAEESIPASEEHNPPAPEGADMQNLDAETENKTADSSPAFVPQIKIPAEKLAAVAQQTPVALQPETQSKPKAENGYFARIKQGLAKTRSGFANLFLGKKALDDDLIEELETQLLMADVGMEVTNKIISAVTAKIDRKELKDAEAVKAAVRDHMLAQLTPFAVPLNLAAGKPFVILMTGINGAGKTTTIGKLAHHFQSEGKKVMLAAGDTFRAAAVEQLQTWGQRNNVPVISQGQGADAASVAYDALQSATARGMDVLIIDTAGRLHTQDHLMEELKKIKRVLSKNNPDAPHETMLILDAGNGQNALRQAEHFHKAMALDGIVVTKLDGTAKGGIVFAISEKLGLPIRYIGVGEQAEDLRPFNAADFVNALLYND